MLKENATNHLLVKKLSDKARLPMRAHSSDAGLDLYASEHVNYRPGMSFVVPTGIAVAIPEGCVGMICDRSSMALVGMKVGGGIIDAGYRGEIKIILHNLKEDYGAILPGTKVAQMLILPIALNPITEVSSLDATDRGAGGFGSTGK